MQGTLGLRTAVALAVGMLIFPELPAQFPDAPMLDELKQRMLEPGEVFPGAAEIPIARLRLDDRRLNIQFELHAAATVAVPLPARLAAWSPVAVQVDGNPSEALRRDDGSLWVVVDEGVHQIELEGLLAEVTEWEWSFALPPRRVEIDALGWTVSGVRPNGVPGSQVLFERAQEAAPGAASYEAQPLGSVVVVERELEIGLVWQVQTTVRRLSPPGRGLSLRIPTLKGEQILTPGVDERNGLVGVNLGANQSSYSWSGRLEPRDALDLKTQKDDAWVERWTLIASPIWNITLGGLPPIFEANKEALVPTWNPWPGESADLKISRPEAVPGATLTISRVAHEVRAGYRQQDCSLDMALICSVGRDFELTLPEDSHVTELLLDGKPQPVRMEGERLVIAVPPGEHNVRVAWKNDLPLGGRTRVGKVVLPVEATNIQTTLGLPTDRWVLWTNGPLRGPAVRFWTVLACSLLAAWVLGRMKLSPLRFWEWALLALGLTQVPLLIAGFLVLWFFFLAWRARPSFMRLPAWAFNLLQIVLIGSSAVALIIFVAIVAEGLLGRPEMFIAGNGSTADTLRWFQARSDGTLPEPHAIAVSVWFYRLAMLAWALWLAAALIRWLRWGWGQFTTGGIFLSSKKNTAPTPPPIPSTPT
jgi:hypothetical protein